MLQKFKSRKFLMALLSVILGVLGMLGVADGTIETVSSIALIIIPVVVYIVTEGKIDAAAVNKVIAAASGIVDIISDKVIPETNAKESATIAENKTESKVIAETLEADEAEAKDKEEDPEEEEESEVL